MKNLITAKNIDTKGDLANSLKRLLEKYRNGAPEDIKAADDDAALRAFNGYYALNAQGAFFAIDANMIVSALGAWYYIELLVCLDGKNPEKYRYTGSFDGSLLQQTNSDGLNISLTFTRADSSDGPAALYAGTITLPGQASATSVTGSTYNNPIPPTVFGGKYYQPMGTSDIVPPLVLQIMDNSYELLYSETDGGHLQPIPIYLYNFNMYYFAALTSGLEMVFLIMGSAAEGGLACNNIIMNTGASRSLQTIPYPAVRDLVSANPNSEQLAAFSGYYQLPSIAPGAFISIEGEYYANPGVATAYQVKIGVSMNGVASNGYYFEAAKMTFINNTLTMPDQGISIIFNRTYNRTSQSLVTIQGDIEGHKNITGYTLFNPIPLSVFGGVTLTDSKGKHSLTIVSDTEVIYDGTTMDSIIYVPIMYILANPTDNPTTEMSFGTNGLKGTACIVTTSAVIVVVEAIPNG